MGQWFFNLISEAENMRIFSGILRLSLSILCGGILGIERGKANRSAGMRTYSLVCMSAALVMLTGEYMYEELPEIRPGWAPRSSAGSVFWERAVL